MTDRRVGLGIDIHRFSPEGATLRPLVLGGVVFPGETGLVGHSDADVVAHALADAFLSAAGLGDLGVHFPDTAPANAGADSLFLLGACMRLLTDNGWWPTSADATVLCERPAIAPRRDEMVERLVGVVGAPVHVKGTRPEGLGSLGRVEGIGCLAVALIER